jgi:hypothetical protein
MMMEDQDWLDRRLAAGHYVPDEGFTSRVVERLPDRRTRPVMARQWILAATAFLAICLAAAQIVPLFRDMQQFAAHHPVANQLLAIVDFAERPFVLFGIAASLTALAFASIPFLRRWA